jgi:flagellar protein FlaI
MNIVVPYSERDEIPASTPGKNGKMTIRNGEGGNGENNNLSLNGVIYEVLENYFVAEGMVSVKILRSKSSSRLLYYLTEPELNDHEKEILEELRRSIFQIIKTPSPIPPLQERETFLKKKIESYLAKRGESLSENSLKTIEYLIIRDFLGYGIIDPVMKDRSVEDISCDGVGIPIYVYHKRYQNLRSNLVFKSRQDLDNFIVYLAQKGNKQVSVSDPIVDTSTPEGNRVNAAIGNEVTVRGGAFTIRLFNETPFTPVDLVTLGTASTELMAYIWLLIESGKNIMIIGGTGVGKTSTLNAISLFVPPTSKIVSIEDTSEINIPHQNWIPAVTRSGVGEGRFTTGKSAGEIDMFDLVLSAMRQRPDYMIVGEVRGKEAYNLFQAMSMGQTTLTTMHAESVNSMLTRLENQPLNIPRTMITSLGCVIVQSQVRIRGQMQRRITDVSEIILLDPESNELTVSSIFTWDGSRERINFLGESEILKGIMVTRNIGSDEMAEEMGRRSRLIRYLTDRRITGYRSIWEYITKYYENPEELLTEIDVHDGGGYNEGF